MKKDAASRIAIIGAGAAGLTAAETLKEKGYNRVTLFEKEEQAGGKCRSFEYEGRSYELGAGIIAGSHQTIIHLADREGVPYAPISFGENNYYDTTSGGLCPDPFPLNRKIPFLWQLLLRYRRLCIKYQNLQHPGLLNASPELFLPYSEWMKHQKLPEVEQYFAPYFTGFGYGYGEEIPVVYVLKYYNWDTLRSYLKGEIYHFPEGIQNLWTKIAARHDIRYRASIRGIHREGSVIIDAGDQRLPFDILLLACPLDETLPFLDASTEEKSLFSKIIYNDYQTYACFLEDFPQQTGFLPANFHPSQKGHPLFWYKRYADSNLYTLYVLGNWQLPESLILRNIENAVRKLGGRLNHFSHIARWRYFPHVSSEELQNGYYPRLERLQGLLHTYYVGELLNFSTVEGAAAYAKALVEQHF